MLVAKHRITGFGFGALVAAFVLAFTVAVPTSAQAAAPCKGPQCNGLLPEQGGCADGAGTLDSRTLAGATVLLRYNATCRAAWVKVVGPVGTIGTVANTANPQNTYQTRIDRGSDAHSQMVNDMGIRAAACMTVPGAGTVCTDWK
ncbi:YjfA family protein [Streptomyces sp. ASQP_92]|uniref:YjfA family protein n=1 Tax=Streptomyces sp. ASQP_92 TaxID=2979116 RepID=UPI0021C02EF0|nr:YjfA family protein [Streptomyces sp. ASQP_92]MCT9093610.1 YjfA family protein [Streptomyces sp. ASQP_92]